MSVVQHMPYTGALHERAGMSTYVTVFPRVPGRQPCPPKFMRGVAARNGSLARCLPPGTPQRMPVEVDTAVHVLLRCWWPHEPSLKRPGGRRVRLDVSEGEGALVGKRRLPTPDDVFEFLCVLDTSGKGTRQIVHRRGFRAERCATAGVCNAPTGTRTESLRKGLGFVCQLKVAMQKAWKMHTCTRIECCEMIRIRLRVEGHEKSMENACLAHE